MESLPLKILNWREPIYVKMDNILQSNIYFPNYHEDSGNEDNP